MNASALFPFAILLTNKERQRRQHQIQCFLVATYHHQERGYYDNADTGDLTTMIQ